MDVEQRLAIPPRHLNDRDRWREVYRRLEEVMASPEARRNPLLYWPIPVPTTEVRRLQRSIVHYYNDKRYVRRHYRVSTSIERGTDGESIVWARLDPC